MADDSAKVESGFNTPVDDPNHYNFGVALTPPNPDEQNRPGHTQHIGGYRNDEDGPDVLAEVLPKKDNILDDSVVVVDEE